MPWRRVRSLMGIDPPDGTRTRDLGDGEMAAGQSEDFIKKVQAIRDRTNCSYAAAMREVMDGDKAAVIPSGGNSSNFDIDALKDEIKKEILEGKNAPTSKGVSSMAEAYEKMKAEEKRMKDQIREEEERREADIEARARDIADSRFKTGPNQEEEGDGLPKDPLAKIAYQSAMKNIEKMLSGDGGKKNFELNEQTIGAIGDILTNVTDKVTATVDRANQRAKSKDFILNMSHIIQVLKAAGMEKEIRLADVIRIMELAEGVVTQAPPADTKTKKEVLQELESDMDASFAAAPPPPPPPAGKRVLTQSTPAAPPGNPPAGPDPPSDPPDEDDDG